MEQYLLNILLVIQQPTIMVLTFKVAAKNLISNE